MSDEKKTTARGAADWVSDFITENTTAQDGTLDIAALRGLASANGVDTSKYPSDTASERARLRMTVGNMLRGKARKRHGLKDVKGTFEEASADFRAGLKPATEDANGVKIKAAA